LGPSDPSSIAVTTFGASVVRPSFAVAVARPYLTVPGSSPDHPCLERVLPFRAIVFGLQRPQLVVVLLLQLDHSFLLQNYNFKIYFKN